MNVETGERTLSDSNFENMDPVDVIDSSFMRFLRRFVAAFAASVIRRSRDVDMTSP